MTISSDVSLLIRDWNSGMRLRGISSKYGISAATAKNILNKAGINTARIGLTEPVLDIIRNINTILAEFPDMRMTVRQVYYQLAIRKMVPLSVSGYRATVSALTKGRTGGYVAWDRIEDRTRRTHIPSMWNNVSGFIETVLRSYRRNIWKDQPSYFEVWLEKNALFGIVEPICKKYGVTLQPITGYSSLSTPFDALKRLKAGDTILYLGDHDASGIDIDRSLGEKFIEYHGKYIKIERIALVYEDIDKYTLPENFEKESDSRFAGYRKKGFFKQAELDALPPNILVDRIEAAIIAHLDMKAFRKSMKNQEGDLNIIRSRFGGG